MPYFAPSHYPLYVVGALFCLVTICFFACIIIDACRGEAQPPTQRIYQDFSKTGGPSDACSFKKPSIKKITPLVLKKTSMDKPYSPSTAPSSNAVEYYEDEIYQGESSGNHNKEPSNNPRVKVLHPDIYVNPLVGREGRARYPY